MSSRTGAPPTLQGRVWLAAAVFTFLAASFGIYVYWEKRIDRANDLRHESFLLADELRQSSDDLTRMARSYVVTGDPRYKKYFQDILEIRDGRKPRPEGYQYAYWDLRLANASVPYADHGQTIALLDLMRQAGFTDQELSKLAEAKANSDRLTTLELEAMKLAESIGPEAEASRAKARSMLYGDEYLQDKAAIMAPINDFMILMDRRTLDTVRNAQDIALLLRVFFVAASLATIFILWRIYLALRSTLGGTADDIHAHIVRIGQGDFSTNIMIRPGTENSVLGGLSRMQAKLKANELELKHSEAFKKAILNSVAAEICVLDHGGTIVEVNEPWRRFAKENATDPRKQVPGTDVGANYLTACGSSAGETANGAMDAAQGIEAVLDGRAQDFSLEYPCNSPEKQRWFRMNVTPLSDGARGAVVIAHTDITERKLTEQALAESEERFSLFMDTLPAAAYIKDEDGIAVYANRYMSEVLGVQAWHGKRTQDLFPPELAEKMVVDDQRSLEEGYAITEEEVPGVDGQVRVYQTHKFRIPRHARGPLIGGISLDITERKRMEDVVRNLAYFDTLTGLPNRRMLLDRMDQAVLRAKRYGRSLALMFLDLDKFKQINDTLGHDVGDELLKEVAARLNDCVRTGDTVARIGGDEFVLLLSEIAHQDDPALVAEKIIRAINVPVRVGENALEISTSIGIAVFPTGGSDDAPDLMKKADKAMYAAKNAGRNGYRFFAE